MKYFYRYLYIITKLYQAKKKPLKQLFVLVIFLVLGDIS